MSAVGMKWLLVSTTAKLKWLPKCILCISTEKTIVFVKDLTPVLEAHGRPQNPPPSPSPASINRGKEAEFVKGRIKLRDLQLTSCINTGGQVMVM